MPLFELSDLRIAYGAREVVRGVSLHVEEGERIAIVGESGSGKTQSLLAALDVLPREARVSGIARFRGQALSGAAAERLRGDRIAMVFQEPMSALDPLVRVGDQIAAPCRRNDGRARARALLADVGLEAREHAYPHQLSGGERQRVMIAMALVNQPDLIIADEPTTALDASLQKRILDTLATQARGLAMILVTHDLRLARRYASRLYVMREGRVTEAGATAEVFAAPREVYTKSLIDAEPIRVRPAPSSEAAEVLAARTLRVRFGAKIAVDDVDLSLRAGRTLAVVGESGSGKSTLARALLRLIPAEGEIVWSGERVDGIERARLRRLRGLAQIVFQDPYAALSPRLTIGEIVVEGLTAQGRPTKGEAARLLEAVGLDPALAARRPDALSGGQRQRIAIARALALDAPFLALDEPTSSLDRAAQRDVIDLIARLQAERGLALMFITHDLGLARALADDILVMRSGRVVERGPAAQVLERPQEDYTRELMEAAALG